MHPVRQNGFARHRHPFQEIGIKQRPVLLRHLGKDRIERRRIVLAHVARGAHAGDKHRQAAFVEPCNDRIDVFAHGSNRHAAQRVVGTEFHDHRVRRLPDRPVEPGEAAGTRVTRHAGIDHLDVVPARLQRRFQLHGKRGLRRQLVAGREAVAERDDLHRIAPGTGHAAGESENDKGAQNCIKSYHLD